MSGESEEFKRWKSKRDAAFCNLTLETATALWRAAGCPPPMSPDVPLIAAHKARLQWLDATDVMLAESMKWLRSRGYTTDMRGAPALTPQQRDSDRRQLGWLPLGQH